MNRPFSKKKPTRLRLVLIFLVLALLAFLLYQIPSVRAWVDWKTHVAFTYTRGVIDPVQPLPSPAAPQATLAPTHTPSPTPIPTAALTATPTPEPSPTPLPGRVELSAPPYEKQGANNCGPATLALYLNFYGWEGSQDDIAAEVKPFEDDSNVNVDELVHYVRTKAGWLSADYRVGGTVERLRQFISAGIPVVIEESLILERDGWPNDDRWAGHYLLLTGYDDAVQSFIAQDTWLGPNRVVAYTALDKNWQSFNRVYILVYKPEQAELVNHILGSDADMDTSRTHALEQAKKETETDPRNAFAWFNLGTNLSYFDRNIEAAQAYDQAREIGLPQRMLRYQFGPFIAYFTTNRTDDLIALTTYALGRTPYSEEAHLWHGWALYRQSKKEEAIAEFNKALQYHPGYAEAKYAIDFVSQN